MFGRKKLEMPTEETALPGRSAEMPVAERHAVLGNPLKSQWPEGLETAIFGLGCFWGAERKFWELPGVYTTAVGYAAGVTPNPSYEEVCSGGTGHNEVVLVVFDPAAVSYERLLQVFFESHDPTQGMRQGNDVGTQYRSGIYTGRARPTGRPRRATLQSLPGEDPRPQREHGHDHDGDPRCCRPSTTPRTTTSSTCTRTRWATAGSAAWESPSKSGSSASA